MSVKLYSTETMLRSHTYVSADANEFLWQDLWWYWVNMAFLNFQKYCSMEIKFTQEDALNSSSTNILFMGMQ